MDALFRRLEVGSTVSNMITQNDHTQLAVDLFSTREWLKRQLRPHSSLYQLGGHLAKAREHLPSFWSRRRRSASATPTHANGWKFELGSSGPFGEDTDGTWQTFDDAAYTWL